MKKMNNILKMISQMDANANEVKLAKHEVQLSAFDNLEKKFKDVNLELSNFLDKEITEINNVISRSSNIKTIIDQYKPLQDEMEKLSKMVKELGLGDTFTHNAFAISVNANNRIKNYNKHLTDTVQKLESARRDFKMICIPDAIKNK
jgi:flagellar biosynthesis/type III secretory pathway chaperone